MSAEPDSELRQTAQHGGRLPRAASGARVRPRHRAWAPRHRQARRPRLAPQPPSVSALLLALFASAGLIIGTAATGSTEGLAAAAAAPAPRPSAIAPAAAPAPAAPAGRTHDFADPEAYARLAAQLRLSLDRADARRSVPRSFRPSVRTLRRSLWDGSLECGATTAEHRHDVCVFGDPQGKRTVVALGSSHMTMWMSGLAREAARRDTRLVGLIKFGCTPYELRTTREGREWRQCARFREWAVKQVEAIEPDRVIVGSHSDFTVLADDSRLLGGVERIDAVADGAAALASRLREHAGGVVVLGDTMPRSREPGACLRRTARSFHRCEAPYDRDHVAEVASTERAVRAVGADFFDTSLLTCLERRCPVAAAGRYIYRDSTHVSRLWSRRAAALLADEVGIR